METIALLVTSLLFGGMTLFSFGFAAFVFFLRFRLNFLGQ